MKKKKNNIPSILIRNTGFETVIWEVPYYVGHLKTLPSNTEIHPQEWNSTAFSLFTGQCDLEKCDLEKGSQKNSVIKIIYASIFTWDSQKLWIDVIQIEHNLNLCLCPRLTTIVLSLSPQIIPEQSPYCAQTQACVHTCNLEVLDRWMLFLWYCHIAIVRQVKSPWDMT